jgi:hypothetical protein
MRLAGRIFEFIDRMAFGNATELHQGPDSVAAAQFELAATMPEEQLGKHSVSKQPVQLRAGREYKKQDEDPELHEHEPMPGKLIIKEREEPDHPARIDHVVYVGFDQTSDEDERGIDTCLEQDRLDQWCLFETTEKGHLVGDQHGLANDECHSRSDHKASQPEEILA